ncbi:hypothetical protein NFI95_11595 [Acetobacteraceae bacterium KSS8]|uniref:Uncharacterized protein n=1 Tax=Endosaccharibacter trunci TaxID=2812733 RepID=A0ABT1W873_9PROT|nr:hypothetical protein [Acetobacteraceae bacterium KSS8]
MSDWLGSLSSGEVRIPATFQGTARLLDGTETPTPPKAARHDDLPGRFEAELDISFALLIGVGYQPVDPSHPAYPLYLAARAEHERAPPAALAPAINPHDPDMVVMPFETTVTVTEAMALRHGLMAPGRAGSAGDEADPVRPVRRRPAPPIWHRGTGIGPGRDTAPPRRRSTISAPSWRSWAIPNGIRCPSRAPRVRWRHNRVSTRRRWANPPRQARERVRSMIGIRRLRPPGSRRRDTSLSGPA